jgi:hypothetical protein
MSRYPGSIRYFAVLLALLYVLASGHLLCAHFHCSHSVSLNEHDCACKHSHQEPEEHCDHECSIDAQLAIRVPCNVGESVSLLKYFSADFVSTDCPVERIIYRDTFTICSSALSLRLHLLYGVLLI